MKKLVFAFASVALAGAVGAATMSWKSGTLYMPNSSSDLSFNTSTKVTSTAGFTAYLYVLDAATYGTYLTAYNNGDTTFSGLYADHASGKLGSASASNATYLKGVNTLEDPASYSEGNSAYAAVVYTGKIDTKDIYLANIGTYKFDLGDDASVPDMAVNDLSGAGAARTGWQSATSPVPEPTSGLLLLCGLGALALRRRRLTAV